MDKTRDAREYRGHYTQHFAPELNPITSPPKQGFWDRVRSTKPLQITRQMSLGNVEYHQSPTSLTPSGSSPTLNGFAFPARQRTLSIDDDSTKIMT
ncbi:hypothetical protein DPMN_084446 [Dreissena polymorpha]|uniref:Uncharacterized protein n=1 Tax=Dreissena polymorpha TaxID=45954 RepID=A0A9D3YAS4_DREPO|nr:hypothetical protein DPMN_084446 [Dreissena polymorpha]